MEKYNIDFRNIRYEANKLLLHQERENLLFPLMASRLIVPGINVIFDTLENYACITKTNINQLTGNRKVTDGLVVKRGDLNLILHYKSYNSEKRCNWTNAHEIGHLVLGHKDDFGQNEIEANFFASCILMPDPVIRALLLHGMRIFNGTLCETFGVSMETADKKIDAYNKLHTLYSLENDMEVEEAFSGEIERILWDESSRFIDIV